MQSKEFWNPIDKKLSKLKKSIVESVSKNIMKKSMKLLRDSNSDVKTHKIFSKNVRV